MTFFEFCVRLFAEMQPLAPYMLIVMAATVAVLPALGLLGRGVWVNERRFGWASLFLGLHRLSRLRLAGAWCKLVLLISYLAAFQKLTAFHYILLAAAGVLAALDIHAIPQTLVRILWLALETGALLACNLICGYVRDMNAGVSFLVLYVMTSLFTALFGVYLFLTELNDISAGRKMRFDGQWRDPSDPG